nr:retrovirus-related Pol polyprotein from transposon TNT 1-94 [Tanacetum cinerariifolium]
MSQDVLTVGSTMRIPLLFQGEYSQWSERATSSEQPPLKDKSMWSDQEKKIRKIDRLARSLLIQGLPNDIYSIIDSNKTAKDLWDALERHMLGSEYGEQDRKAVKCGYSKDNCELNFKFLKNLQPEWKQYATMMRQNKNLLDINIDALYNILKQNQGEVNDVIKSKKKVVVITSDPLALPTNNNLRTLSATSSANKKQEYVKYDDKKEEKKVDEKKRDMSKVKCYNCKKEGHFAKDCKKAKVKDYDYYKTKMLLVKKNSDEQVLLAEDYAWMESNSDSDQEINANMVFMAKMEKVLSDSAKSSSSKEETIAEIMISQQLIYNNSEETANLINQLIKEFDKKIAKYQKRFENPSYFYKAKDLRPTLYDERVIGIGYTSRFLAHSDEALDIEKFKRARENKIEFAYDYGNLNASYVNEKIIFSNDYFQEIINPDFEKIDSSLQQTSSLKPYVSIVNLEKIIIDLEDEVVSLLEKKANLEIIETLKSKGFESSENAISESENQSENDCHVVEKGCDNLENSNMIAPGMFKINVSQSVSPISAYKTSCASKNVENKTKRKRRKRMSSKQNDKQVNNDVLRANKDFVYFSDLDTLSSIRRPKHSGVIWKKNGSSNTSNVVLSSVSHSKLNKDVKRYSHKDLLSCNNSHRVDTRSAYDYNHAINVSCNSRSYASYDVNDLFVFDDIVQICLWIIDSGCSKHMTGNRALLTNFVEKFFGTVCFGNNDFAVIAGYGDVVIGSMTIKKVYYVKGLRHNLFCVGQFFDKGLEVAFQKSTCFVRNEDGVDLLTDDRSSNLYTIALNKITSNSLACLLAKASSLQSWLWHQRLSHLNFATINNLVKKNLVRGLPKMKFEKDHLCSACKQGKIHQKHHKSKTAFASNKPLYLLHMDLCGPMRFESINGKRYVLVVVDDYSRYTWRVRTDNGTKFKNKTLAKFFDEVGISQQFSAARTPQQNGVVERRNRTLVEAARTMLTFVNLPLFLWAEAIATTCFTQNRSIIHKRFDKTPYELINKRKPNIKFFHVFGYKCYLLNDYDDVGKLKAKGDIRVFVGYSKESASFRVYNKCT